MPQGERGGKKGEQGEKTRGTEAAHGTPQLPRPSSKPLPDPHRHLVPKGYGELTVRP